MSVIPMSFLVPDNSMPNIPDTDKKIMHTARRSPDHFNDSTNTAPLASDATTDAGVGAMNSSLATQVPAAAKLHPAIPEEGEGNSMTTSSKAKREMDMITVMQARAKLANMQATFPMKLQQQQQQKHLQHQQQQLRPSAMVPLIPSPSMSSTGGISPSNTPHGLSLLSQSKLDDDEAMSSSINSKGDAKTKGLKRGQEQADCLKENDSKDDKDESEEPKGKRRKKGKKPMDMPRRALSAYNIFFSEQRKLILEEIDRKEKRNQEGKDPDDSSSDLEGDLSGSGSGKHQQHQRIPQPGAIPCVLKQRRLEMTRTKRAHRKVHGKISLVVLAREVSKRWKELSDENRKYYEDLAEQDKLRHKEAMNDYKERKAAENMLKITQQHHAQWAQASHLPIHPSMGLDMDESMLMMMNNNPGVATNPAAQQFQLQQQHQQLQQQHRLGMMGQDHNPSISFQEALLKEQQLQLQQQQHQQQQQQYNRRQQMLANLIGGGGGGGPAGPGPGGDYGGSAFGNPSAFAAPPPQPNPPQAASVQPATAVHQNSVIPLTDLEHMMIMKSRAAAARASTKAMMQFASHGQQPPGHPPAPPGY